MRLKKPFVNGLIAALLSVLVVPVCWADTELVDLVLKARKRDPAYAIARAQMDVVHEQVRQARAGLLPTLSLNGSATKANFDEVSVEDRRFNTQLWTLQFSQPLFRLGNFYSLSETQQQYFQAEAQLAAAESDVAQRVVTAWFDVLSAQEVLKAVRGQKEATQQQLAAAKRSFELGAVSIADVRDAEAKNANVQAQEAQAESDLMLKRELLGQISDAQIGELNAAEWSKPDLSSHLGSLDDWQQSARDNNPSIVQARYAEEAAKIDIKKARSGHAPTVDFVTTYNMDNATGSSTYTTPVHNKTFQYGVQVTVPIFEGFGTDAKVGEAVAQREKARGQREQSSDQVLQSVKQAYFGLKGALVQIPILETAEAANKVSVQANVRGYQFGLRTNSDVLNAQAQLYQSEKDLAKVRFDAWMNYVRLRILVGDWLEKDLQTNGK
jgi:outer membrane protein